MEIPNADNHTKPDKIGYLLKQYGRSFPYLTTHWKKRFCVLANGLIYVYEKDTSIGVDRTNFVIDLKFFDLVEGENQKESKKVPHVFTVSSSHSSKGLFELGRHSFAADTLHEMEDWLSKIRLAIECSKNNNKINRPEEEKIAEKKVLSGEENQRSRRKSEEEIEKKNGYSRGDLVKSQSKSSKNHLKQDSEIFLIKEDGHEMKGKSNDVDTGLRSHSNDLEETTEKKADDSSQTILLKSLRSNRSNTKPPLECITKYRNKGPSGRRAPQTRPSVLLKQRASSMSALQQENSEPEIERLDISSGVDRSPYEVTFSQNASHDNLEMNAVFDNNVESALFFPKANLNQESPHLNANSESGRRKSSKFLSLINFPLRKSTSKINTKENITALFRKPTFKCALKLPVSHLPPDNITS